MLITICDLETTGLDVKNDEVTEIGAILYCTKNTTVLSQYSVLLPSLSALDTVSSVKSFDKEVDLAPIDRFFSLSSAIVGHNFKSFDSHFFGRGLLPELRLPIIDTMSDIKFPKGDYRSARNRGLDRLALDHDIPVWRNHRALTDCSLIAHILSCYSSEELEKLFSIALEPKELYISLEAKPGTESKKAGFSWNSIVPGRWAKYCGQSEIKDFNFSVTKAVRANV